MWKPGICRAEDLKNREWFGRQKSISYSLLQLSGAPSSGDVSRFEEIVRNLKLSSGVFRTTYRGRFSLLDPEVTGLVLERFPGRLRIHDLAVSDALASKEWCELIAARRDVDFVASDRLFYLVEAASESGGRYFCEPDGTPLQYADPPWVVTLLEPEPIAFPVNRWVAARARARLKEVTAAVDGTRWDGLLDESIRRSGEWTFRQIPLAHPEARQYAEQNPSFRLAYQSVFEPLPEPVEVVRAMNILNLSYFGEERLREACGCLIRSLEPGGVCMIGRSDGEKVANTTVFERQGGRLGVLRRFGTGSEIEPVALSATAGDR